MEADSHEGAHYSHERKFIEFMVAPLSCEIVLLFRVCTVEEDHYGGVRGIRWGKKTTTEYLEDRVKDIGLYFIKPCL